MNLVEVYILYNEEIEKEYFNNLIKILGFNNKIHLIYEKYHNTSEFAYEKYIYINNDINYKTTSNFIILLNVECPKYSTYLEKIENADISNNIHIFSMDPCFEAFLISHFVDNFIELQEQCKREELLGEQCIDNLERLGKEINNSCNHCEHYIRNNSFIEDYEKNCLPQVSKFIKNAQISKSYEQIDTIPKLINYFKLLLPNIIT